MESNYINLWEVFTHKTELWIDEFLEKTPNIVLALIVFFLGFLFARFIKNLIIKLLNSRKIKRSAIMMIGNLISIFTIIGFLLIALNILNLDNMLKTILAGAGVAGLAIGLALQGTLSNTFSGITLSFIKDIRIGDQIETNGYIGTIEDINLRVVKLKTPDGNTVIIPNKSIIENPIKNYSDVESSNIILKCGVGYESDLDLVKKTTLNALSEILNFDKKINNIVFFFTEFGDSSINFEVRFFAPSKNLVEIAVTKSNAIVAIKKAFDREKINIPFPIRTLNFPESFKMDSGNENLKD